MTADDKVFSGSIPEIYDRFLVPLIFSFYADDLARRVGHLRPKDILETAAGTGVLTRAMSSLLGVNTRVVSTDLNEPMLAVAAKSLAGVRNVEWKVADALNLPFSDDEFDVVTCQFGVMFFPDKVQGFREAKRVLRKDGTFLFSVWDDITKNEFIETVSFALAEMFPHDPPKFMERTPHGYSDSSKIREDLSRAGFRNVTIEFVPAISRASSARDAAIGYCQGNPLRNEIEARDPAGLEVATKAAETALEKTFGKGPIEARIQALVVTATD